MTKVAEGRMRLGVVATVLFALAGIGVWYYRQLLRPASLPPKPRTIERVIRVLGPHVDRRLRPAFERAGYPGRRSDSPSWPSRKRSGWRFMPRTIMDPVRTRVPDSRGERNDRSEAA